MVSSVIATSVDSSVCASCSRSQSKSKSEKRDVREGTLDRGSPVCSVCKSLLPFPAVVQSSPKECKGGMGRCVSHIHYTYPGVGNQYTRLTSTLMLHTHAHRPMSPLSQLFLFSIAIHIHCSTPLTPPSLSLLNICLSNLKV